MAKCQDRNGQGRYVEVCEEVWVDFDCPKCGSPMVCPECSEDEIPPEPPLRETQKATLREMGWLKKKNT